MRALQLYPRLPVAPVEVCERLDRDPACTRCDLHKGVTTVCVPPMGEPGGVLLVGEGPGRAEDAAGRPFQGRSGSYLYQQVQKHWQGPIAVANSTGCAPIKNRLRGEISTAVPAFKKNVDACRPYLARAIELFRPRRIVVLGKWAARGVLGRDILPLKQRRAYGFLFAMPLAAHARAQGWEDDADELAKGQFPSESSDDRRYWIEMAALYGIPVFCVTHPAAALRNRFIAQAFEADLEWALTADPPLPPLGAVANIVETPGDSAAAVADLRKGRAGFDIESGGIMHERSFRVVSIAAARADGDAFVWDKRALADQATAAPLGEYIEDSKALKIGAHFQFDQAGVAVGLGRRMRGVAGDVRLWRKLLDTTASRSTEAAGGLDEMVELVGMSGMKGEAEEALEEIVDRVKRALREEALQAKRAEQPNKRWPKRPPRAADDRAYLQELERRDPMLVEVIRREGVESGSYAYALLAKERPEIEERYNALDALGTARLADHFDRQFAEEPDGLRRVRDRIVNRATAAVARVEEWGIAADKGAIRAFDAYLEAALAPVMARLAPYPVTNWGSPQQVAEFLFKTLKLKSPKQTASGQESTGKDVLQALAGQHPAVDALLEMRRINKLRSVYAGNRFPEGLLEHVRENGRIHCTIYLDGAETGRMSASNGLHQIPGKKFPVEGKMSRDCFVAPPGKVLLSFDYGQIELRRAADISGDPKMIEIFRSGVDYHLRTAQLISRDAWGIAPEDVTDEHRAHSKNVNFGLLYGMGDVALAKRIFETQNPTRKQIEIAGKIRVAILGNFTVFARWIRDRHREARMTGEVWTTFDDGTLARRRRLWDIADQDEGRQANAQNAAQNTPIQGKASDDLLRSLIACVEWIDLEGIEEDVKAVLPIHDQILFEVTGGAWVAETIEMTTAIMEQWPSASGLVADVEIGPAWGSLRKMKREPDGWKCFVREDENRKAIYTPPQRSPWAAYEMAIRAS